MRDNYAVHVNLMIPLRFPDGRGTETVPVEVQVSTQVKDVIQRLTHQLYEDRRKKPRDSLPWQWNFKDEEFTANYLGHMLHYIEGTIMRLRHGREG